MLPPLEEELKENEAPLVEREVEEECSVEILREEGNMIYEKFLGAPVFLNNGHGADHNLFDKIMKIEEAPIV